MDGSWSVARDLVEIVPRMARLLATSLQRDATIPLTLRQYRLLGSLMKRPHRTGELAAASYISQPTVTSAIATLAHHQLVRRIKDPRDGRATLIAITAEGAQVYQNAQGLLINELMQVIGGVDDVGVIATIHTAVRHLRTGLERID